MGSQGFGGIVNTDKLKQRLLDRIAVLRAEKDDLMSSWKEGDVGSWDPNGIRTVVRTKWALIHELESVIEDLEEPE